MSFNCHVLQQRMGPAGMAVLSFSTSPSQSRSLDSAKHTVDSGKPAVLNM